MTRRNDAHKIRLELTDAQHRIGETLQVISELVAELTDALPGYPTTSGGGGSPTLDAAGNPPGLDRYLDRPDPATVDLRTLRHSAIAAANAGRAMHTIAQRWLNANRPDTDRSRGSDCQCCQRYVPGTDADRLRAGLCMACYRDWKRAIDDNPWIERSLWMHQRRLRLDEQLEPTA